MLHDPLTLQCICHSFSMWSGQLLRHLEDQKQALLLHNVKGKKKKKPNLRMNKLKSRLFRLCFQIYQSCWKVDSVAFCDTVPRLSIFPSKSLGASLCVPTDAWQKAPRSTGGFVLQPLRWLRNESPSRNFHASPLASVSCHGLSVYVWLMV